MDAWEIVAALGGVVGAGGAVWAAWEARKARAAASDANKAAAGLARIEEDRRRAELTPVLAVTCDENNGISSLLLKVRLDGPPGLDRVDTLTATIRDDSASRARNTRPGGPSAEEVERHVWAPYRLVPGAGPDGALADETGRTIRYEDPLQTGETLTFLLEPTSPPPWSGWAPAQWREKAGTVLRVSFTMTHAEHGTWTLAGELELEKVLRRSGGPARIVLPLRH